MSNTHDYLRPTTDSAFRRLFSDRKVLIYFLNAILPLEIKEVSYVTKVSSAPVSQTMSRSPSFSTAKRRRGSVGDSVDVEYDPIESVGAFHAMRLIRYDLVCVTSDDRTVNVEMQTAPEHHFLNRLAYYSSRLITERQGWSGKKPPRNYFNEAVEGELEARLEAASRSESTPVAWDYELRPVYVIAICEFPLSRLPGFPAELHDCWLAWAGTFFDLSKCVPTPSATGNLRFDNVANYCLISLSSFSIVAEECKTSLNYIIWLLKHLGKADPLSLPSWVSKPEVTYLLSTIKKASLTANELADYEAEVIQLNTLYNTRIFGEKVAREEGEKKGFEEGAKKGFEEGAKRGLQEGLKQGFEEGKKSLQETLATMSEDDLNNFVSALRSK